MKKYIWLAVTQDEYELPVAVADTAEELAAMVGTSVLNVRRLFRYHHMAKRSKVGRYCRVEIGENEEE